MTPDRRTLLALFSLAFGLRLLFAAVFGSNPAVVPAHETYAFHTASRMAAGFAWITTPFSPNAPGYLILLSTAFRMGGVSWWTAVLLNAVLGALTALFLYRIGERRLGRCTGLGAALWLGLSVRHMNYASVAIRDVTTTFFLAWFVYALVTPFRRMRSALWLAFLFTLLAYTESVFILLLPLLLLYLARFSTHHRELSIQYVFLFLLTLVVISIPWTVRNFAVHGGFVPVSLEAVRDIAPLTHPFRHAPPATDLPAGESAARDAVVHAPGFVHNTVEFWRAARFRPAPADPAHGLVAQPAWSLRHNAVSIVNYGVLLPFFLVGAAFAVKRRHRAALVLTSVVVSYAIVWAFKSGDDRARLVVEPLIMLVAAYGVRQLFDLRRRAGAESAPAA